MDLYVVLAGFRPSHHQLGFEVTPLVWFLQSELLLIKPSSHTVMTVVSVAPLTDMDHSRPEHTHVQRYWNIDKDTWKPWYKSHTVHTVPLIPYSYTHTHTHATQHYPQEQLSMCFECCWYPENNLSPPKLKNNKKMWPLPSETQKYFSL